MKKKSDSEFQYRFGRMIKGVPSLMLEENQLSDSQNMTPGFHGWEQRKGMSELTTTAIASALRFKSMLHFRDMRGDTNAIMAHVYEAANGERIMKQTTLPPSTHLGNTWEELYDLTASCENTQFDVVAGNLIMANNKEFLAWRGEQYIPSGVWKYSATTEEFINFYDELTDNNASTSMLYSSATIGDYVYVVGSMPLSKVLVGMGDANGTESWMIPEYYNGVWTILKAASWWSNVTWVDDDCDSLTGWVDGDNINGVSSQGPFFGRECFIFDTNAAAGGNRAKRTQDIGTFGNTASISVLCYHDNIGTTGDSDYFALLMNTDDVRLNVQIGTDGLFVYDGASLIEVGTNIVDEDEWVLWTFVCDFTTAATATCSVYKNGTLVEAGVDCSDTGAYTDGEVALIQSGVTTADQITYVAQVVVGDGLDTVGDAFIDGTSAGGIALAQDGDISWTDPGDATKTIIDRVPGYAFRFAPSLTIDSSVSILEVDVASPLGPVRALWSGIYVNATGCYLYDGTDHTDYTLYVGNGVESQYLNLSGVTTTDKIYVGFPYRVNRIRFFPSIDGKNTGDVSVTAIKYYSAGGSWTSVGTFTDTMETNDATFSQKGYLEWADPGRYQEKPTKVGGDDVPWFWYEITVDAALDDPTYIYYIDAVDLSDDPDYCFGCFGWKRRAWQIAPLYGENQVRYSAQNNIDIWTGIDSGYIEFGERPLKAGAPFYNETLLFADTEIWMLQGNSPSNFGRLRLSARIGTAAPQGVLPIEPGTPVGGSMKNVVVWPFYDGFWMFDGVRLLKISAPDIDSFFDPDHDDYINPAYLSETQAEYDHETQCGMWTVYSGSSATTPTKVIVLHFPTLWYGIHDYGTDLGPICRVYNDKYYSVAGGNATGKTYLLNDGVTDINASGTAVAVDAYVISRDMFASYSDGLQAKLLSVWAEAQEDGGQVEIDEYPDGSKTPQNMLKKSLTWHGKLFGIIQKPLKAWSGMKTAKFRIRNRSKNARMNLLGFSTTVDKGRTNE